MREGDVTCVDDLREVLVGCLDQRCVLHPHPYQDHARWQVVGAVEVCDVSAVDVRQCRDWANLAVASCKDKMLKYTLSLQQERRWKFSNWAWFYNVL